MGVAVTMMTSKRIGEIPRGSLSPGSRPAVAQLESDGQQGIRAIVQRARMAVRAPSARPLRALLTGAVAALLQLFVLDMLLANR
jgi:hypothetical protein